MTCAGWIRVSDDVNGGNTRRSHDGGGRRVVQSHGTYVKASPTGRAARAAATTLVAFLCLTSLTATSTSAATRGFSAVGSAKQVYVTGLTPSAQTSLLAPNGQTVQSQKANSLGGLLFRDVAPGRGYRVVSKGTTSRPVTVHSDSAAPWDPGVYAQSIPDNGYSYLTTRDGTKPQSTSTCPPARPESRACRARPHRRTPR